MRNEEVILYLDGVPTSVLWNDSRFLVREVKNSVHGSAHLCKYLTDLEHIGLSLKELVRLEVSGSFGRVNAIEFLLLFQHELPDHFTLLEPRNLVKWRKENDRSEDRSR